MTNATAHIPRSASRTAYGSVSLCDLGLATLALIVVILSGTICRADRLSAHGDKPLPCVAR